MKSSANVEDLLNNHAELAIDMWNAFEVDGVDSDKFKQARSKYEETVATLLKTVGPKYPCKAVDIDLWGRYIEMFSEKYGMAPGENTSFTDVKEWMRINLH